MWANLLNGAAPLLQALPDNYFLHWAEQKKVSTNRELSSRSAQSEVNCKVSESFYDLRFLWEPFMLQIKPQGRTNSRPAIICKSLLTVAWDIFKSPRRKWNTQGFLSFPAQPAVFFDVITLSAARLVSFYCHRLIYSLIDLQPLHKNLICIKRCRKLSCIISSSYAIQIGFDSSLKEKWFPCSSKA